MFKDTMEQIKKAGKDVGILHASNSPALLSVILVITSIRGSKGAHIPASLGVNYFREER